MTTRAVGKPEEEFDALMEKIDKQSEQWTEMALPVPNKSFLETSPDTAMLFAPFGHCRK